MICPACAVQMHQYVKDGEPQGGGKSTDTLYETWEHKRCPNCGRWVKEYYSCEVIGFLDRPDYAPSPR